MPHKWRTKLEAVEAGEEGSRPSTHVGAHRKEILQLKRLLAEKAMEVNFEGSLAKNRGSTPARHWLWRDGIYEHIRELMPLQGRLSIEHMCQLVMVSRRSFYRSLRQREPAEEEMEVRSLIQQIALEHRRRYGYRRITAELQRRGVPVGRKKVARMMREDNLLGHSAERVHSYHELETQAGDLPEPS